MEIVKLKINDITPYSKNAKKHPQEQIDKIKKSIEQFGMNVPIAVWGGHNVIVYGHGRYEALKQLGYTEVDCVRLDHLSDAERKAFTLVDNKLTMDSEFDFNILDGELASIDLDLSAYDFNLNEYNSDEYGTEFELSNSETPQARTITLTLNEEQFSIASAVMEYIENNKLIKHDFGNHNKRSNALFESVYLWAEQNQLL